MLHENFPDRVKKPDQKDGLTSKPAVSLDDLELAVEWVSSGYGYGAEAYVCRKTGRVYTTGHDDAELEEEMPDDIGDPDRYEEVPSWKDLDMSKHLVMRFVREHLPEKEDTVQDIFSKSGAFSRYKEWLVRQGQLEAWYAYEDKAKKEALVHWITDNFGPR